MTADLIEMVWSTVVRSVAYYFATNALHSPFVALSYCSHLHKPTYIK